MELIHIFPSVAEAAKAMGKNHGHISNCAHGKKASAYGYKWKFIEEE